MPVEGFETGLGIAIGAVIRLEEKSVLLEDKDDEELGKMLSIFPENKRKQTTRPNSKNPAIRISAKECL